MLQPLEVTSPKLDSSWAGASPVVTWRAEPDAQWVWTPAKDETLRFIPLTEGVAPRRHLSGKRTLSVAHGSAEDGFTFEDLFGPDPGVDRHLVHRESTTSGEVDFYP